MAGVNHASSPKRSSNTPYCNRIYNSASQSLAARHCIYQVCGVPDVDEGAAGVEVLCGHGVQVDVERARPRRPLQLRIGPLRLAPLDRLLAPLGR